MHLPPKRPELPPLLPLHPLLSDEASLGSRRVDAPQRGPESHVRLCVADAADDEALFDEAIDSLVAEELRRRIEDAKGLHLQAVADAIAKGTSDHEAVGRIGAAYDVLLASTCSL